MVSDGWLTDSLRIIFFATGVKGIHKRGVSPHRMNHSAQLSKPAAIASWIFQVIAAVILLQTLFFKFTGAPESVYIFSKLGVEPWGRYGAGVAELIAAILLFWPRFAWAGAVLGLGVILGAIGAHLGPLGIEIVVDGKSDGGELFGLAVAVFVSCAIVIALRFRQIPFVGQKCTKSQS